MVRFLPYSENREEPNAGIKKIIKQILASLTLIILKFLSVESHQWWNTHTVMKEMVVDMNLQTKKILLKYSHTKPHGLSSFFHYTGVLLSTVDYQFAGHLAFVLWSKCWENTCMRLCYTDGAGIYLPSIRQIGNLWKKSLLQWQKNEFVFKICQDALPVYWKKRRFGPEPHSTCTPYHYSNWIFSNTLR